MSSFPGIQTVLSSNVKQLYSDTRYRSLTVCGVICASSGQKNRMFSTDEFWKGATFGAVIIGVITMVLLKLLKKIGTAGNKPKKQPTEHDERFC